MKKKNILNRIKRIFITSMIIYIIPMVIIYKYFKIDIQEISMIFEEEKGVIQDFKNYPIHMLINNNYEIEHDELV